MPCGIHAREDCIPYSEVSLLFCYLLSPSSGSIYLFIVLFFSSAGKTGRNVAGRQGLRRSNSEFWLIAINIFVPVLTVVSLLSCDEFAFLCSTSNCG